MIRLLMTNCEFPPLGGGAGHAHAQLLRQYAQRDDLDVHVLTAGLAPCPPREQFAPNVVIYRVPLRKANLHYWRKSEVCAWLSRAGRLYRRLIRAHRYDLAHAFFAFPSGYPCYRQRQRLPYLLSLRGSDVPGYNRRLGLDYILLAGLFRRIWRNASAVVANSEGLRRLAQPFTPELPIDVIPNGVDTEAFAPVAAVPSPHQPWRALAVARLVERKRLDILIAAVAQMPPLGVDAVLTIAGEGNILETLRRRAAELGVLEKVVFLGRTPPERMPELYRQHDCFVMASRHEGMSNAMLEALASGLPVVTVACEGVSELIADNGVVLPEADPAAFARALAALAQDRPAYRQMAAAARRRAEAFSWHSCAQQYLALYRRILNGN